MLTLENTKHLGCCDAKELEQSSRGQDEEAVSFRHGSKSNNTNTYNQVSK